MLAHRLWRESFNGLLTSECRAPSITHRECHRLALSFCGHVRRRPMAAGRDQSRLRGCDRTWGPLGPFHCLLWPCSVPCRGWHWQWANGAVAWPAVVGGGWGCALLARQPFLPRRSLTRRTTATSCLTQTLHRWLTREECYLPPAARSLRISSLCNRFLCAFAPRRSSPQRCALLCRSP